MHIELTDAQVSSISTELAKNNDHLVSVIDGIVASIEHILDSERPKQPNGRPVASNCKEAFKFIPSSTRCILDDLSTLRGLLKNKTARFLDVGCGIGNVLALSPFWCSHGIEFDPLTLKYALFPVIKDYRFNGKGIFNCDACGFKHYDKYNIIFYYCPMCDITEQQKLELLIEDSIKPGAYLIPYGKNDYSICDNRDFTRIHDIIWRKNPKGEKYADKKRR